MKWIDAFLCFRQQRVVVNGVNQTGPPLCQVSHRAPFLVPCCFLYTSMTSMIMSDIESEIRLFADDCD